MLGQCRRQRVNIKTTVGQRLVFAGFDVGPSLKHHRVNASCFLGWLVFFLLNLSGIECSLIKNGPSYTVYQLVGLLVVLCNSILLYYDHFSFNFMFIIMCNQILMFSNKKRPFPQPNIYNMLPGAKQ